MRPILKVYIISFQLQEPWRVGDGYVSYELPSEKDVSAINLQVVGKRVLQDREQ